MIENVNVFAHFFCHLPFAHRFRCCTYYYAQAHSFIAAIALAFCVNCIHPLKKRVHRIHHLLPQMCVCVCVCYLHKTMCVVKRLVYSIWCTTLCILATQYTIIFKFKSTQKMHLKIVLTAQKRSNSHILSHTHTSTHVITCGALQIINHDGILHFFFLQMDVNFSRNVVAIFVDHFHPFVKQIVYGVYMFVVQKSMNFLGLLDWIYHLCECIPTNIIILLLVVQSEIFQQQRKKFEWNKIYIDFFLCIEKKNRVCSFDMCVRNHVARLLYCRIIL